MRRRIASALLLVLPALAPGSAAAAPAAPAAAARAPAPLCAGRYADTLSAMREAAREREARPAADWVYCLRATAVYEHLSYGRGGRLRRQYYTKVRHGTGFAYRTRGADSLLATNHHVVSFPDVTGEGVELDGVPPGSRRVREEVRIVANESEPDGPGQITLAPVVADEALDLAVLATPRKLDALPYALGSSGALQVGDAVLVRGFPLGAFPAANAGRVIGVGQRDLERGWDHEDFAVDALLNLGSSGSPVLAVSCATGELELVGVYHAGYRGAQGLNVVIGVDELRPVLTELRAPPQSASGRDVRLDPAAARAALGSGPVVMPFGGRAVRVERAGESVRFAVLDPSYPLSTRVELSIVDRGGERLEAGAARAGDLRQALWEQLDLVLAYRRAEGGGAPHLRERLAARIRDREDEQADLVAAVRAGADGLGVFTSRERAGAVRNAVEGPERSEPGVVELILSPP
jgi:serine protease Do